MFERINYVAYFLAKIEEEHPAHIFDERQKFAQFRPPQVFADGEKAL